MIENRRKGHRCRRAIGCVALTAAMAVGPGARAGRPTPEEVLFERGLTNSGAYFLVASESDVFAALKEIRPLMLRMADAGERVVAKAEAAFHEADDARINLESQLDIFAQRLLQMPRRNQVERAQYEQALQVRANLRQNLSAVNAKVEVLGKRLLSPLQVRELHAEFEARKKEFVQARTEMQPLADKVLKDYAELEADPEVRYALNAFGTAKKFKAQLGPSPALKRSVGMMKDAERMYSPETAPARAKAKRKPRRRTGGLPVPKVPAGSTDATDN